MNFILILFRAAKRKKNRNGNRTWVNYTGRTPMPQLRAQAWEAVGLAFNPGFPMYQLCDFILSVPQRLHLYNGDHNYTHLIRSFEVLNATIFIKHSSLCSVHN